VTSRLAWLFRFSNPENTGTGWLGNDAYHHWQIAYLSLKVGLAAPTGPRLWDFKGQDYFWGVLHPALTMLAFALTGSTDIAVQRLVSIAFGVLAATMLALMTMRHFGRSAGLAAGLLAAVLPTSVFNDSTGLLEPLGVGLTLLGIWLLDRHPGRAGIALALSTMARAESWIFAPIVIAFDQRARRSLNPALVATFALGFGGYAVYLFLATGNPIYPFYWNFLANGLGTWGFHPAADAAAAPLLKPVMGVVLLAGTAGLLWAYRRRPAAAPFLGYGLTYCCFIAGVVGFTAYSVGWHDYFLLSRLFAFPYQFVGALVAALVFTAAAGGRVRNVAAWVMIAVLAAAAQALWQPIDAGYRATDPAWNTELAAAQVLATAHVAQPGGTTLAIPPNEGPNSEVTLTYALVHDQHLTAATLRSEFYDPYYYLPAGFAYSQDPGRADSAMRCWFSSNRVGTWVVEGTNANERALAAAHPDWFTEEATFAPYGWTIYAVHAPPC
jgi:hypothetical protein